MVPVRKLSLRFRRCVCALGVLSILAGLGLDVHATVMLLHAGHVPAAAAPVSAGPTSAGSRSAGDEHDGAARARTATAPDAHAPGQPHHDHGAAPGGGDSGESALECCNATLCPSGPSGLPSLACAADGDRLDGAIALTGNGAPDGIGSAPLLRPPR